MQVLTQANESYIGTILQGKEEKVSYKLKKVIRKPKEEWVRVEGMHRAIVSKEDFWLVQELLKINARASAGEEKAHKYTGLLFCADCGGFLVRRSVWHGKKKDIYFVCSSHNQSSTCGRHTMAKERLDFVMQTILSKMLVLAVEKESMQFNIEKKSDFNDKQEEVLKQEIEYLQHEAEKYQALYKRFAFDRDNKVLSEADYNSFCEIYEKQCDELAKAALGQKKFLAMLPVARDNTRMRQEHLLYNLSFLELDRILLLILVNRILIYKDNRISIEIRCREMI